MRGITTKSSPFDEYSRSALDTGGRVGIAVLKLSLLNREPVELGGSRYGGGEDMLRGERSEERDDKRGLLASWESEVPPVL